MKTKVTLLFVGVASLLVASTLPVPVPTPPPSNEFYINSVAEGLLPGPFTWSPEQQGIGGQAVGFPLDIDPWSQMNPYLVVRNQQNTLQGLLLQGHPGEVIWEGTPAVLSPTVTSSEHFPPNPKPPTRPPHHHKPPSPQPTPEPSYAIPLGLLLAGAGVFRVVRARSKRSLERHF